MKLFLEITYNFGILIAISIIAGFVYQKVKNKLTVSAIQGTLFGTAAIIGMLNPVVVAPGLIFDGRSVMISLAGLFYGPLAAIISAAMAFALRLSQGGVGARMGISVITASALIGTIFHYRWILKEKKISEKHLFLFGVFVHIAMLFCTTALPSELRLNTLNKIWLPVLIVYPLAGIIIGRVLLDASDHWLTKKKLEASEEKFRILVKNSSDTLVILEADGTLRYISPSAEKITGFTVGELLPLRLPEIIHPDDLPRVMEAWQQMLTKPELSQTTQYRHMHKTKGWVYLEAVGQNFLTEPSIRGIVSSVRDISERQAAENALRDSEEKIRLLLDLAPDAFFQGDGQGNLIGCNNRASDLTGYTKDELLGKNISFIFTPKVLSARPLNYEALKQGAIIKTERELRRKDGSTLPIEMCSRQMPDGTYQSFFRDISERKQAEVALLTEKERLMVTLRSIGDGVITTDTDGKILMLNYIAEKLTGWNQADAFGKELSAVFNIINDKSGTPCENPVEKVLLTGQIQELANNTVLIAKDGSTKIIGDSGAPIKDQNGEIIGVVLVFRDMTEKQKLIEAAQQSQKLDSIGILAGGIAHDFNNLLGGIFGYIGLARSHSKDENINELLEKAHNAIERAKNLTHQLLTFAKGGEPVKKHQELNNFITETVHFAMSGSSISTRFDLSDDLYAADIDRNQIAQVIDNIIINAIQSMPMGGIISVKACNIEQKESDHALLQPGNYVKLTISDQGIGIPKEIIKQIFDPFFTTKSNGHGLGLAMSYSIVRKHDGIIEVDSESGKGSNFHIYLPTVPAQKNVAEEQVVQNPNNVSGRVLVMDDEPMLREIISEILKACGYEVAAVADGESAIKLFTEEKNTGRPFKAVIFDLTVPGAMGGKEAIAQIRKIDTEVAAFVSSGYSDDPVVANPPEYGFWASIPKPFSFNELKDTLEKYLKT